MTRIIEFGERRIQVPEDATDAEIEAILSSPAPTAMTSPNNAPGRQLAELSLAQIEFALSDQDPVPAVIQAIELICQAITLNQRLHSVVGDLKPLADARASALTTRLYATPDIGVAPDMIAVGLGCYAGLFCDNGAFLVDQRAHAMILRDMLSISLQHRMLRSTGYALLKSVGKRWIWDHAEPDGALH